MAVFRRPLGVATGASRMTTIAPGCAETGVAQRLPRFDRLGLGVVGAVGVEPVGDRAAERRGEEEEEDGEEADSSGATVGEAGERVEHQPPFFCGAGSSSWTSIRSHQSASHSLNSIPPRSTIGG